MKKTENNNKNIEAIIEAINEFKSDSRSKRISYKNAKIQYDYVSSIFPELDIDKVEVYLIPHSLMKIKSKSKNAEVRMMSRAAGFYFHQQKVIIIGTDMTKSGDICADVSVDEILVHELLHYARHHYNKTNWNVGLEEEFAYGYSIDYFYKIKKMSEIDIVNKYLSPFLAQKYEIEKLSKKYKNVKDYIEDFGLKFVKKYMGKSEERVEKNDCNRMDLLDI